MSLSDQLGPLDGAKRPGGCDRCDAYQRVWRLADSRVPFAVKTFHDDDCPFVSRRPRIARRVRVDDDGIHPEAG